MSGKAILLLLLQILGFLPLLAYPAVMIANLMQLSALLDPAQRKDGSLTKRFLMGALLLATTAYPLVLWLCRVQAGRAQASGDESGQWLWSAAPLLFVGALALCVTVMSRSEGKS